MLAQELGIKTESGTDVLQIALECAKQFDNRHNFFLDQSIERSERAVKKSVRQHNKCTKSLAEVRDYEAIRFYVTSPLPENVMKDVVALDMLKLLNWRRDWEHVEAPEIDPDWEEPGTEGKGEHVA